MSLGKKDISKNISTKTHVSFKISEKILNSFLELLKSKSFNKTLKISNFGTFERKFSPERIGRNPKTGEEFEIPAMNKLHLIVSNKVKVKLN